MPTPTRTSKCYPIANGSVMRVTVLDECGQPFHGQCVSAVSDGFSEVALTVNTQDANTRTQPNARGRIIATVTDEPKFQSVTAKVTLVQVEPIIVAMMTGAAMKIDPITNKVVGFGIGTGTKLDGEGFALEIWSDTPSGDACAGASQGSYGYQVVPWLKGGMITGLTLNGDFANLEIDGATSRDGNSWGVGPYNDVYLSGAGGALGALPAGFVDPSEHLIIINTEVPPPTESCDCLSSGTTPTTATAGTPGTFNGQWIPETLLDLTTPYLHITATPATGWATGQHVILGDGSHAHWSGTAWIAGNA